MFEIVLFVLAAIAGHTAPSAELATVDAAATETPIEYATPIVAESEACEGREFASAEEALQQGCCSHHGGVCGCRDGRRVCCDRQLSPTCRC